MTLVSMSCVIPRVSPTRFASLPFSVEDGSCHILGDSIPIYSDKITTNARLYYNERQSRLFVTVQETSDDVSSKFSVYSLLFPPVSLENIQQITVEEMLHMCGWYW